MKDGDFQWVQFPPGNGSLQPVAIGAVKEVTKFAEAFDGKGHFRRLSEHAGRNASERRAGLEKHNVGADPPCYRGRPPSLGNERQMHPAVPPG